jgi:hypothetical protein
MIESDVANAVVCHGTPFSRRQWLVVPNVSWGWGLDYEADLIAVSKLGRVNEIEIKVSLQDLKADIHKQKWTKGLDNRVQKFWYAVPNELAQAALELELPSGIEAGVIAVWAADNDYDFPRSKIIRAAKPRMDAKKATTEEITELYRLGYLRYWDQRLKGR